MPPQLGSSAEVGLAAAWPAWFYAFATRSLMQIPDDWKNALGILSVALAVVAAIIYVVQTFRGEIRPHPLSWFLFGTLSATGYWVQRAQGAQQGSWTLMAMTIICFLFVAASVMRGERSFSRQEWAFAVAGGAVFILYLFTREANVRPRSRQSSTLSAMVRRLSGAGLIRERTALPVLRSTARSSSPRSWRWSRFHSLRPFTPRHCSS